MDLKRLSHLVALAEECHFARAAERVHLSQPAFSRSIQSLEGELGMRLFDRETGDVKPTPAGEFLIGRARRLLFDARNLRRDVDLFRETALGDTAFGAGPYPAATIMPMVVSRLRQAHPGVRLRLEMNNWQLLFERLLAEDIEFLVSDTRDIPPDPNIQVTSIGHQMAHLYVRAGHPLAAKPCSFAQVWSYGLGGTRTPLPIRLLLAKLLALPAGELPVLAVECDDLALLRVLGATTDSVVALPAAACRDEVKGGVLVELKVTDLPDVYSEMGIVTLPNRTPSPMAQRAIACVKEVALGVNVAA